MNDRPARAIFLNPQIALLSLLLAGTASAADQAAPGKVLLQRDFGDIQREVETLRGKKFLRPVPVYKISAPELRNISDHELDKEYPGEKLRDYEELLVWLDMVPPDTDLKEAEAAFSVNEVAGLYDSEAKEMCIPSSTLPRTNAPAKKAENKLDRISLANDEIPASSPQPLPTRWKINIGRLTIPKTTIPRLPRTAARRTISSSKAPRPAQ